MFRFDGCVLVGCAERRQPADDPDVAAQEDDDGSEQLPAERVHEDRLRGTSLTLLSASGPSIKEDDSSRPSKARIMSQQQLL